MSIRTRLYKSECEYEYKNKGETTRRTWAVNKNTRMSTSTSPSAS